MTRYELTTLSVKRGATPRAAAGIAAFCSEGAGTLLGCWSSDVGALNRIAVLRGFADDAELSEERERTVHSSNPFGCAEHVTELSLDSYAPFPNLPPVEPGAFGPVYEIRSYVLNTGGLGTVLDGWAERLHGRIAFSKLLVAMYSLNGTPRITHIWPYASMEERVRVRAASIQTGAWPPNTGTALTPDMRSAIYLPTAGSPLT